MNVKIRNCKTKIRYHNDTMVNFRAGVTVTTTLAGGDAEALWVAPPNTTVVKLIIAATTRADAGNYTCAPENMVPDTIRLSISQGEPDA